jgi:hypothetical protein
LVFQAGTRESEISMSEKLYGNVLTGFIGIGFGLTIAGILFQHGYTAIGGFLILVVASAFRWSLWHEEGE